MTVQIECFYGFFLAISSYFIKILKKLIDKINDSQ